MGKQSVFVCLFVCFCSGGGRSIQSKWRERSRCRWTKWGLTAGSSSNHNSQKHVTTGLKNNCSFNSWQRILQRQHERQKGHFSGDSPVFPSFLLKHSITVTHALLCGHINLGIGIDVNSLFQHVVHNAIAIFPHIAERAPNNINSSVCFLEKIIRVFQQKRNAGMGYDANHCHAANILFIALGGCIVHSPNAGWLIYLIPHLLADHLTWVWHDGTKITVQLQRLQNRKRNRASRGEMCKLESSSYPNKFFWENRNSRYCA